MHGTFHRGPNTGGGGGGGGWPHFRGSRLEGVRIDVLLYYPMKRGHHDDEDTVIHWWPQQVSHFGGSAVSECQNAARVQAISLVALRLAALSG